MKNIIFLILVFQKNFSMEIPGMEPFIEIPLENFNEIGNSSDLEEVEISPPHQSLSKKIYNLCCCFPFCKNKNNPTQ